MQYTGGEIIVKLLENEGITKVCGIPGGANLPLYDALSKSDKIEHILARHEQGGGFIAQGIARATGKVGVCLATSGPGVTNLLTAIADAKLDSVPLVAITGQVSSSFLGTDAFQEVDTCGLAIPITKHNFFVRSVEELLHIIPEAFRVAESGRPGPVLVDIPRDVQMAKMEVLEWPKKKENSPLIENKKIEPVNMEDIAKIAEVINRAKRPILYIGGGILQANAHEELYKFAKKNNIPVASTLMGLGSYPSDDDLYLGMLGMHGAPHTNIILNETDLLIALGVRFDDRATGNITKFCPNATVIHVDIDPAELNKNKIAQYTLAGDLKEVLEKLFPLLSADDRQNWIDEITKIKNENPLYMPRKKGFYHPLNFIKEVGDMLDPETIITTDVGQHQMWVAQAYPFKKPRKLLTSGGLGTMGFGLPVAIGAALANPDKKVICISGDGSFLMNIQELATLAELNLNITVIILNNGCLGMVRQQQEFFFNKNYVASKFKSNPDFASIANAFGVKGYDFTNVKEANELLRGILSTSAPSVINVPIDDRENVLPIVPPGAANYQMIGGKIIE